MGAGAGVADVVALKLNKLLLVSTGGGVLGAAPKAKGVPVGFCPDSLLTLKLNPPAPEPLNGAVGASTGAENPPKNGFDGFEVSDADDVDVPD